MPKPLKPAKTPAEEEILSHLTYLVGQVGQIKWYVQNILKNQGHPLNPADQAKIDAIFAQVEANRAKLATAGEDPGV